MSLMRLRIRSACQSLRFRQLCTSTSKSDTTHHFLISTFNRDTFLQHLFSIPIIHQTLSLGSKPTSLLTPTLRLFHPKDLKISQYLNPFFLLHPNGYPHSSHTPILTYNPSTQQTLTLPLDPHSLTPDTDTATLSVDTHFGFDPLTKTHKVLRLKWTVAIPEPYPRVTQMVCTVLTLGCSSNGSWRKYGNSIVAFDLKDEEFRLIPRPHDYKAQNFILPLNRLIELGGCLALVADKYKYGNRDDDPILQLWILKDYHNHVWVKEEFYVPFYWGDWELFPIGTVPSGEIILKALNYTGGVMFYDMEGQDFKMVDITGLPEWVYSSCSGINTTVSVYEG
ncbi:F-box/LRR-repeat protein At2g40920-like isoform X2 [Quercus robur]|uniref:F-box/LRR-repeat protein At2g40920-like isoform X2 n=1 Tax=Quercus robur TaxID=38942 RepID=UPI0021618719|nr:F-box/LRR-repeat protein At2g40920-like isoform X2 [Quercus robur]